MKKNVLRFVLILLGSLVSLALLAVLAFKIADRTNGSLVSSGERRTYLLYVPESYDSATPTPLVITFHGYAQWPAHQEQVSQWNELADEYGFLVVYPSGRHFPKRWQAGINDDPGSNPEQDIRFIADLIDQLAGEYNLDASRIYANGLSNGGGMSFILSCELSERIAAVGLVAGAYLYPWEACHPSRAVPAVVFHGTADQIVPFQGGPSRMFDIPFPAIPQWVDSLAEHNDCEGMFEQLPLSGEVSGVRYTHCAAEVVFYTITGGGHSWPSGQALPEMIVGHTTHDIDATRVIWDFFMAHPQP